jgi:hypothetical protein
MFRRRLWRLTEIVPTIQVSTMLSRRTHAGGSQKTWDLVPRPPRTNVVTDKWIWTHKRRADGTLERYKAR